MRLRAWLHRRRQDGERGATMVVVAGVLVALFASAAIAIDLSAARAQQQQAQTAADAAALAAADSIPAGNTSQSVAAVSQTATSVATTNLPGSTVAVSMPSPSSASVTVSGASGNTIGGLFGSGSTRVSASATASVGTSTSSSTATTSPSNVGIYAADTSCDAGLTVANTILGTGLLTGILSQPSNNVNITGTVISNGDLGIASTNSATNNSSFIYGGPNGCSFSDPNLANDNTVTKSSVSYPFPKPYTSSQLNCTSTTTGTLSYTVTALNATVPSGIYCATSAVNLTIVAASANLSGVTIVAPQITLYSLAGSIGSWTPNANASGLLAWDNGTSSNPLTINMVAGNINGMSGTLYAPNAAINITGSNVGTGGLIEGYQVHLDATNLNWAGAGPAATTSGTTTTSTTTGASNLTG